MVEVFILKSSNRPVMQVWASATVYHLWKATNHSLWEDVVWRPDCIVQQKKKLMFLLE